MPIRSRDDAVEVESRIRSIFDAPSGKRGAAVRALFVEVLDFDAAFGDVDLGAAPGNVALPASAERCAHLDGVHVLYLSLDASESDRVRQGEVTAAARLMADQLGDDLLLVFTNASASQLHLIHPSFDGARPTLRRMVVERDLPRRTAAQQVSNIYWNHRRAGSIRAALEEAFDVEPVTKAFFAEYRRVFETAEESVSGFGDDYEGREDRRRFVQTLFNRLMFVYFLSRKGWLIFKGDKDYLNALWRDYRNTDGDNFYAERLWPLFFYGLNKPSPHEMGNAGGYLHKLIGDVPFLNGGLFERSELDERSGVTVSDEAIEPILTSLFDRFNFTVMESTPFDVEVAVDPEMLGKVFEELVTGRHDSGAYYTPRPVVSFMCREALKGYLDGQDTGLTPEDIARFVDGQDTEGIQVAQARRVAAALEQVTVVDPACGSGAYLLGMMQELIELQTTLFNAGVDAKALYDLKLEIIQRNLYGVDIDDFAVNIAMLRLWLSLAIEYEGERPEPLPNLDFKVVTGDSLLGPDPSTGVEMQGVLGYDAEAVRRLGQLKAEYIRASLGPEKERLRQEIRENENGIRNDVGTVGLVQGAIDWRVEFAEVFARRRGFDIAIANPPYIHLRRLDAEQRRVYDNVGFATLARMGDIYQLFYERGCQLLIPKRGLLAFITSNSWLKAEYGKSTRKYFSDGHTPLRLLELGKDVFESAIVDSGVLVLRTGGVGKAFPGVDMDRLANKEVPPQEHLWGQVRPDGDAPWSILSPLEWSVMDKMQERGTPLAEWDVSIHVGILTGLNKAFIVNGKTKQALVKANPNSADVIRPLLRGRDIQRYRARWAEVWLIDAHNGYGHVPAFDVSDFPAIKAHLDQFYPDLAKRREKGRTPYNVRDCAYHEDLAKEKLVWIELADRGRFAYDDSGVFCLNSTFMMSGEALKYLCSILNSSLTCWFMQTTALNSGMGTARWIRGPVQRIPVPRITTAEQRPFVELIDHLLAAKDENPNADTGELEAKADQLVYGLYDLTREEVAAVEKALGLRARSAAVGATQSPSAF